MLWSVDDGFTLHNPWVQKSGPNNVCLGDCCFSLWICFNLCLLLSQISDSVSLYEWGVAGWDMAFDLQTILISDQWNEGSKNSIRTSSERPLSCHRSDYLHPRWPRNSNVKVINTAQLWLRDIGEQAGTQTAEEEIHRRKRCGVKCSSSRSECWL